MKRCIATAEAGGHTIIVLTKDPDSYDQQTVWAQLEILVRTILKQMCCQEFSHHQNTHT
jgi:hypothetical protein